MTQLTRSTMTAILDEPCALPPELADDLRGFSGLHGGLAVALLGARLRDLDAPDRRIRSITAGFARPIGPTPSFDAQVVRRGRTVTTAVGRIDDARGTAMTAHAVLASVVAADPTPTGPPMPASPSVAMCERVVLPVEFVPFSQHMEIRAVGPNRPFGGGDEATLTAWIRFVADDAPPNDLRLLTLLDSLAPSAFATMTTPATAPTVELSAHLAPAVGRTTEPWVLLRASTRALAGDGWLTEDIDAWAPDGTHLASARQLRLLIA